MTGVQTCALPISGEAKLEFFRDVGEGAVLVDQLVARIKAGG